MMKPEQLSLGVTLNDDATFSNFYATPSTHNAAVLAAVRNQIENAKEPFIYLWGSSGSGLTHLLHAACHRAQTLGKSFQYLPLRDLIDTTPEALLSELELLDFVCLDGLDVVAASTDWQLELFNVYNRLRDAGKLLLVAAKVGPHQLPITLPDLASRLRWGATFHVHSMNDEEKRRALQLRANARGLELNDEVAQFIVQRLPRDMNELFSQLNRLDRASLNEQRKLTIPFVKKVLEL
jgi:DnaA-homolog protein